MTIRRNVDLNAINQRYSAFEDGINAARRPTFDRPLEIAQFIAEQADTFLKEARALGLKTCNCDGIREIEALMFDMIDRMNEDCDIEEAVQRGLMIRTTY